MSVIYRNLNIDCTKDNYILEKVTGYEHGVKGTPLSEINSESEGK